METTSTGTTNEVGSKLSRSSRGIKSEDRRESEALFQELDLDNSKGASRAEIAEFVASHHEEMWSKLCVKLDQPPEVALQVATRVAMELATGLQGEAALEAQLTEDQFHHFRKKYMLHASGSQEFFQRAVFALFDVDNNNALDEDELEALLETMYETDGVFQGGLGLPDIENMRTKIMEKCDSNGDHVLSFSEVRAIISGGALIVAAMAEEESNDDLDDSQEQQQQQQQDAAANDPRLAALRLLSALETPEEKAERIKEEEQEAKQSESSESESEEEEDNNEAEEIARKEAEEMANKEAEDRAQKEAEAQAQEAAEIAKKEAEAKALKESEENAKKEAEGKAREQAEEKAKKEAEAKAEEEAAAAKKAEEEAATKKKAEETSAKKMEEEAAAAKKAEEEAAAAKKAEEEANAKKAAAQKEAEAKEQKEAEERAQKEAEEKALRAEKARKAAKEEARKKAEEEAENNFKKELSSKLSDVEETQTRTQYASTGSTFLDWLVGMFMPPQPQQYSNGNNQVVVKESPCIIL